MKHKETDIPCFVCGNRNGMECPGRKPNEATRCIDCFVKYMQENDPKWTLEDNEEYC